MPILIKIEKNNILTLVWEVNETLERLTQLANELNTNKYKTDKRKKEFLASRLLINEINPKTTLSYNKYGAPVLDNEKHISISHSKGLVAITTSNEKVGMDIEEISEKALRISSKFVSEKNLNNLTQEKATLIWCCKEAIFKWHQKGGVDFIKDILIPEFSVKEKGQITTYFKKQELILNYQKINNHYLVYVCN